LNFDTMRLSCYCKTYLYKITTISYTLYIMLRDEGIYNNTEFSLYDRFREILELPELKDSWLYAVSGFFHSSAYFRLRASLERAKGVKVLVGINADALGAGWYNQSREKRDSLVREQAYRELCDDISSARYRAELEESLRLFVTDVLDHRLQMKAYPNRKVHAKFYLFLPEGWTPKSILGTLITGSSNFTTPGPGTDPDYNKANYELNVELKDASTLAYAKREFDDLWAAGTELIPYEIKERVFQKSFLRQDITPRELYLRFLYETLKENIEYDEYRVEYDFPIGFKRLNYQIDAVNEGLSLLERHNGFMLADVVGLGKTVVATLIIRNFLARQDRHDMVLIVAPPAILPGWERTLHDFGINPRHFRLLSSGSLKKLEDTSVYTLLVVDEAHNFRNAATDPGTAIHRQVAVPLQFPEGDAHIGDAPQQSTEGITESAGPVSGDEKCYRGDWRPRGVLQRKTAGLRRGTPGRSSRRRCVGTDEAYL
jgi:hypothetical protein